MNRLKAKVIAGMVDRAEMRGWLGALEWIERTLNHVRFPKTPRILGTSLKVEKSKKDNTLTAVIYLSASDRSEMFGGFNTCPHASEGCRAACLGHTAGRLTMDSSQNAQVWKTLLFRYDRCTFLTLLEAEIRAHLRRAKRKGLHCSVRLNGSSDIAWERVAPGLFELFPTVQFYDYTKSLSRMADMAEGKLPTNYHLTFSRSEDTSEDVVDMLIDRGCNVAVVFRDADVAQWRGHAVIDGDTTDYRAGDPRGVIVGLSVKGNVEDNTGFYV